MIPRALPRLITDALTNRWRVHLSAHPPCVGAYFTSLEADEVEIQWEEGRCSYSSINGTPTPYKQCTRLIRSPEGATS